MKLSMNKNLLEHKKLVIFDVDGTLYEQKGLRKKMTSKLISYHLFRPHQWLNIPIILAYRKVREELANTDFGKKNVEDVVAEKVGKKFWCSPKYVRKTVQKWMQDEPLPFLKDHKYSGVSEFIQQLKTQGIQVAVYSDLPAFGKLQAMELDFDLVMDSTMPEINCLKPQPKGLIYICKALNVKISEAIFIGDRADRDKACADCIQMDSMLVKNGNSFYWEMLEMAKLDTIKQ